MLNDWNNLSTKHKHRKKRKKKKKSREGKMKRSNGNSKKKKKGKNSDLNRKKSENSISLRKSKEGKKSNCKCQDAIETKEGNQAHQQKKCCKGEFTEFGHYQIWWNTHRLISFLKTVSSRNWQQRNNVKCNEIFVFKRTDCFNCPCIYSRTAIYNRGLPEVKRYSVDKTF